MQTSVPRARRARSSSGEAAAACGARVGGVSLNPVRTPEAGAPPMSCGGFPDGSCARRGVPSRPRWPRRAAGRLGQTRLCEPATRVFEGSEGHQGRPSRPPMSCEAFSEGSCAGRGVPLRPRWPRCAVGRLGHTRLCESPTRVFRGVRWAAPPSHPRPTPSNPAPGARHAGRTEYDARRRSEQSDRAPSFGGVGHTRLERLPFAPSGGGAAGGGGDRALDTRGARLPRGCSTGAEAARFQAHACGLWATTRPALRARGGQRVSLSECLNQARLGAVLNLN